MDDDPEDDRDAPGVARALRARLAAEAGSAAFLLRTDAEGAQHVVPLPGQRATVGRGAANALDLEGDPGVSRLHAALERLGADWVLADDGLSRNGSWVDGERVVGRRRLVDGARLRFGDTEVTFRDPAPDPRGATAVDDRAAPPALSAAQRAVLVALCRPFRDGGSYARPATNREIGEEVHLGVEAVKGHLRALFGKLAVGDVPQNEKRLRLVERAFATGAIGRGDLPDP